MASKKPIQLYVLHANYLKENETEPSERFFITKDQKQTHYLCLDVTELTPEDREEMANHYSAYQNEVKSHLSTFPKLEQWLASRSPTLCDAVKWRSFKVDRILPPPGDDTEGTQDQLANAVKLAAVLSKHETS